MSIFHNPALLGAGGQSTGYNVSRSLRFNSSDSAYLSRTPSSAGNRKTWTWAGWVKRSALSAKRQELFRCNTAPLTQFGFSESAQGNPESLLIFSNGGAYLITTPVFRDVSAWYHITVVFDTTNSTTGDRVRVYVNGSRITTFNSASYPAQNFDTSINTTNLHYIGASGNANEYLDGYLADVHFIDGQALDPTSFTEVSATTGQLIPKAYTGSYGTNGFRLTFSDNSGTTATTLGKDAAGSNNFTPTNFSVSSGAGNDSLVDTPTSYGTDTGAGGEVRGNYCTLNPNYPTLSGTSYAQGNLQGSLSAASSIVVQSTIDIPRSGKWYFEMTRTSGGTLGSVGLWKGVIHSGTGFTVANSRTYRHNGNKETETTATAYGSTYGVGDTIGVAVDMDNGALYFAKNGTWQNSGVPTSGSSKTGAAFTDILTVSSWTPGAYLDQNQVVDFNFGQRQWAYAAPAGFKALCDTNLPSPQIAKPSTVMDVALWTGNGSARSITGLGFNPDLVWIKGRSGATDHALYDAVRGATIDLVSNSTAAETTQTQGLTAFNSDGFSIGTLAKLNTNAATYAAWTWDAGSSTVTNTQGSITSQVRANASAGFSIVTYTGTRTSNGTDTIGHGLGVAPELILIKRRDGAADWHVKHKSLTSWQYALTLNSTGAQYQVNTTYGTMSAPTSAVFSTSYTTDQNVNGYTYVAYCFSPVVGYSSFGSYTGNGSTDGPAVWLGFRPRWVMFKRTDPTGENPYNYSWFIIDAARDTYNVVGNFLQPHSSNQENNYFGSVGPGTWMDFLSNGFKVRTNGTLGNANGGTYIYAAFAENPFQYARAR